MKILMVLTSHSELGNTGHKTGFWLEEFAAPYYIFYDAGVQITLASPKGGKPPIDPNSLLADAQTEATLRFEKDAHGQAALANTRKLSEVKAEEFDAVFYPGGHGPLWDLSQDSNSIKLIEGFNKLNKPIGAVCHASAVLRDVKTVTGELLIKGKHVTGFSNSEENAAQLTNIVPFLVEDMLKNGGGKYTKAENWQSHVAVGGNLVTGQNPASSDNAAKAMLKLLGK